MTRPHHYLVRMLLFLGAVGGVGFMLFMSFRDAFMANPALNGLIVGVLFIGILYNFSQVIRLYPEVTWIENFRDSVTNSEARARHAQSAMPKLLAPMAAMVGDRDRFALSTAAMRTLLDGIASRLDESRDTSRYTIGLLIFLGLLGTFWGLLGTVSSISDVIGTLSVNGGEAGAIFAELKRGLQAPMEGMGTAFSSSLFGLAGSLVLGFLDLQANQAQNRFYNDLEEWLSTVTRLSSGAIGNDGDQSVTTYVQALLEQTAESLENLQRTLTRGEESRMMVDGHLINVGDKLEILTDHMRTQQSLMRNLAETQVELKPILAQLATGSNDAGGLDDASRIHLRNLDVYVTRLVEELKTGREDTTQQIRSEIKLLARLVAASSGDGQNS
ncbi:MAG: flagellar motor protein MotA [Rhodospirillales bacterium]|nr:flagellar motor protein MotA [Rhodospirillales bacterium]